MFILLYILWAFLIYCVAYKSIVLKGEVMYEILASSLTAISLCIGGIGPFFQVAAFIAVYAFVSLVMFVSEVLN